MDEMRKCDIDRINKINETDEIDDINKLEKVSILPQNRQKGRNR